LLSFCAQTCLSSTQPVVRFRYSLMAQTQLKPQCA
jgi:hypothetical protein